MVKFLNLHRKFLINKINIILLFFVIFISLIVNIAGILSINNEYTWFDEKIAMIDYLNNNVLLIKLIIQNVNAFIYGSAFIKDVDSYHLIIDDFYHLKIKYIVSKILCLAFNTIFLILCNFVIVLLICKTCTNLFYLTEKIITLYLNLTLIVLVYGFLAAIFTIIFKSQYSWFLSTVTYTIGELLNESIDNKIIFNIYYIFFPQINLTSIHYSSYGIIHLIFLLFFYFLVLSILYKCKKT